MAPGSSARTYEELAKPVRRRLLFAGEHTCKVCLEIAAYIFLTCMGRGFR